MTNGTAAKKLKRYNTITQDDSIGDSPRLSAFKPADAGLHGSISRHSVSNKTPRNASPYLLTVKQTAARLQLGINCVYSLTKAEYNPLPTVVIGRSIRIPVAALERWLEAQTHG